MSRVSGVQWHPKGVVDGVSVMPSGHDVAAVGVPDGKTDESVNLFIVKKDPALTAEQIKAHARENLTGYKQTRYVEFRDELPKSNVGKSLRRELREESPAKAG